MTSYLVYTFTQGATPTQWAGGSTLGPSGAPFNCYPSPTSKPYLTYTFLATASGCPLGYSFHSDRVVTTSSTCILTAGLATRVSFIWDCVFTVGKDATTTIHGGTSTIADGNAQTITAAPQTITVTQTQKDTTTSTFVVDPGAKTVSVTSTVTQGATPRRRDLLPAFWPDTRAIPNFEYPLDINTSNSSTEIVERSCSGSQCSLLCCPSGETCVGDGHYCCSDYHCVQFDPSAPFVDYYASWLYFTGPIRTYYTTNFATVTAFETTHIAGNIVTVTPTSTQQVTVTNFQTVDITVTQSNAVVTVTIWATILTSGGGSSTPTNPGSSPLANPSSSILSRLGFSSLSSILTSVGLTTATSTPSTTASISPTTTAIPTLVYTSPEVITTSASPIAHVPVPKWTGAGKLLNGYCSTPDYVLLDGPTAYWAPFVGCDPQKTDCCPFDVAASSANYPVPTSAAQGILSQCPDDYQSVSSGCCPSGYELWTTPLGGQTPCFSTLTNYLTPPPVPLTARAVPKSTLAVVNVVYAQYYSSYSPAPTLSTGAKAGIGAGAGVIGLAVIALMVYFVAKKRPAKRNSETTSAIESSGPEVDHQSAQHTMSQYSASQRQDLEPYGQYVPPQHQGIEPYVPPPMAPLHEYIHPERTGYMQRPMEQPGYGQRPAYQSWPPIREQHWQTSQGIYPSPPTSSASPPPESNAHSSQASYSPHGYPAELNTARERQELLGGSRPRGYEMSG